MKTPRRWWITCLVLLGIALGVGNVRAATNDVGDLLRQGLFEEEANHNLEAAMKAYQAVVAQTEKNRQFEATAIFRLGECYRKLGRTNEANTQYQRILSEFADQAELATLSRTYLASANAGQVGVAEIATEQDTEARARAEQEMAQNERAKIELEEMKRLQALLKDSPDLINGGAAEKVPPLIRAVNLNYLKVAKFLLDNHANPNITYEQDGSALTLAVYWKEAEMTRLLLEGGADVDNRDGRIQEPNGGVAGCAALHIATDAGNKSLVEFLVEHKANVNIKNGAGETPLHLAARKGYLAIAQLLIEHGADVDMATTAGDRQTPLHYAAQAGNTAVVELLFARKATVDVRTKQGDTPLMLAVRAGKMESVKALLAAKADINAPDSYQGGRGFPPLYFAITSRRPELVNYLLENHADPKSKVPAFAGNRPAVNFDSPKDEPLLTVAATGSDAAIAKMLLDHGAEVDARDTQANTPLIWAANCAATEAVALLLTNGADINAVGDNSWTALGCAVYGGASEVVKILLNYHPKVDAMMGSGVSPLQIAVQKNSPDIARQLLDAGADVNKRYSGGETPLMVAVANGLDELVSLLLSYHADPNIQNANGDTALSLAQSRTTQPRPIRPSVGPANMNQNLPPGVFTARSSQPDESQDLVELLKKAGANDNLRRMTVISLAREGQWTNAIFHTNSFNHPTLADLLVQEYADPNWFPRAHSRPWSGSFQERLEQPMEQPPGLSFPDFGRITISRLNGQGQTVEIGSNTVVTLDSPLQWGDVVTIPEADHPVSQDWQGLNEEQALAIQKSESITVALVIKGKTNKISIRPVFYQRGGTYEFYGYGGPRLLGLGRMVMTPPGGSGQSAEGRGASSSALEADHAPRSERLASFWLNDVIRGSDLLLSSSDLTRVKVHRREAASGKTIELLINLEQRADGDSLWLRDGDVIEIPEKP